MRILDLGCGRGTRGWCAPCGQVIGVDINRRLLLEARRLHPDRLFVNGRAEALPFSDSCFDRVVCNVALPYMRIPHALHEIHRVLSPAGELILAVHSPRFTLNEWKRCRRLKPLLFRTFVLVNGLVFHLTGWSRWESFQTITGLRKALRRAGFISPSFRQESKVRLIARATRQPGTTKIPPRKTEKSRAVRAG